MNDDANPPKESAQEKLARLSASLGIDKITARLDEQAKTLDMVIREIGNTNQNLNSVISAIQQASQPHTTTTGSATQPPQIQTPMNDMMQDPVMKAELIAKITEALSGLVNAWKGGGQAAAPSPFAALGEQLMTDLVRATVDDVQQRVYGIRKLPPGSLPRVHGPE